MLCFVGAVRIADRETRPASNCVIGAGVVRCRGSGDGAMGGRKRSLCRMLLVRSDVACAQCAGNQKVVRQLAAQPGSCQSVSSRLACIWRWDEAN